MITKIPIYHTTPDNEFTVSFDIHNLSTNKDLSFNLAYNKNITDAWIPVTVYSSTPAIDPEVGDSGGIVIPKNSASFTSVSITFAIPEEINKETLFFVLDKADLATNNVQIKNLHFEAI
ncbi:MAG TPA: hypothetical protein PLK40_08795 [Bacteroidaceae bacterium]|nr:hypothetical protein [Bacteroidaceae bacterium]